MAVHNPLAGVPLRAARWSATHPWRAILAWFVFILIAVGLAVAIPTEETTDADYRLGESGRADAMVSAANLDHPDTENVLITSRAGAPLDQSAAESTAAVAGGGPSRRAGRRPACPLPNGARTGRRCCSQHSWPRTRTTPRPCRQ